MKKSVDVRSSEQTIVIGGSLGKGLVRFGGEDVIFGNNKVLVKSRSSFKTVYSELNSLEFGVSRGYFAKLEFYGLGFRFINLRGGLFLKLGFSHYLKYELPTNVRLIGYKNKLVLFGLSLGEVNQLAAEIYNLRVPDRYKGKGVRKPDQIIKLKVGKRK